MQSALLAIRCATFCLMHTCSGCRASSASEPLLNAAGFSGSVRAARGSPAAVDSGVSSPFRTPRGPPHHPHAAQRQVSPPTEEALRSSAEVFPRSFRIQRTGSSDSLASLVNPLTMASLLLPDTSLLSLP